MLLVHHISEGHPFFITFSLLHRYLTPDLTNHRNTPDNAIPGTQSDFDL